MLAPENSLVLMLRYKARLISDLTTSYKENLTMGNTIKHFIILLNPRLTRVDNKVDEFVYQMQAREILGDGKVK